MADNEIDPVKIHDECMERLDTMVNRLVTIAQAQGATALVPVDLIKMRNTYSQTVSDFMIYYLAAAAVMQLVNQQLDRSRDVPTNT